MFVFDIHMHLLYFYDIIYHSPSYGGFASSIQAVVRTELSRPNDTIVFFFRPNKNKDKPQVAIWLFLILSSRTLSLI